jgi:hypothetical protein
MRSLLFLLLAACGPDAVAWRDATATLGVSATAVTFPPTPLGGFSAVPLRLTNGGDRALVVSVEVEPPFTASQPTVELGAGGSATLELGFRPTDWAHATGVLRLVGPPSAEVALVGPLDTDADDDGAYAPGAGGTDCDDTDPTVHPGAPDLCGDAVDADCDPVGDDDCDQDGASTATDCDDTDATVFPGAVETAPDGRDEDCDGRVDEVLAAPGDLYLSELSPQAPAWVELCNGTSRAVAIGGFTLETAAGSYTLPSGTLEPAACAAVCASTTSDCGFEAEIVLDPSSDRVAVTVEGLVLDVVTIDAVWDWQPGWVWSLDPGAATADGNDDAAAWCRSAGSPGEPNPACR